MAVFTVFFRPLQSFGALHEPNKTIKIIIKNTLVSNFIF